MKVLSKRLFLYDLLNRGGSDFWMQDQFAFKIAALTGILQSQSSSMFQTVLTADDEQKLEVLASATTPSCDRHHSCRADVEFYPAAVTACYYKKCWFFLGNVWYAHYKFEEAQILLAALCVMGIHFDGSRLRARSRCIRAS